MKIKKILALFVLAFMFTASGLFAQVDKAQDLINKGDYVGAVNVLKDVVKSDDGYDVNYLYGLALYKTGNLKDAETYLNKALKKDDEGVMAMKTLGDIYSSKKQYDKADTYYKKAAKLDNENIFILISQGTNYSLAGKVDDAIRVLTLATTISKENADVYVGLGDAYYYRRTWGPAVENYEKALKLNPKNASALFGLGRIYYRQKKFNDAIQKYKDAIEADPNFSEAYYESARLLYFSGKYQTALERIDKYLSLRPSSIDGKSYKAKILYYLGQQEQAETLIDEVLKAEPNDEGANRIKATIDFEQKEYANALSEYAKVPLDFLETEDFINIAKTNLVLGDTVKALATLDSASRIDPDYDRTYFEQGKILLYQGKYSDAVNALNKAIELNTPNVTVYYAKGLAQYLDKKNNEAEETFKILVEKDPKNSEGYYYLAVISNQKRTDAETAGKTEDVKKFKDEAISYSQKSLEIDSTNEKAKKLLDYLNSK